MRKELLGQRIFQKEFAIWALGVHLGGLILLPYYFSWLNLALAFGLAAITAYSLGIFHHMYLSHGSFKAHPALANLGVFLGTLSWRGPMAAPLRYAALHRVHHSYSDQDYDPHSPVHGIFHSLLSWNWNFSPFFSSPENYLRYAGKHVKNKWFLFLDRNVHWLQLGLAIVLFIMGGIIGGRLSHQLFDLHAAIGWVAYGIFAKTLIVIYMANLVDVVNHTVGYRAYETKDQSTNSFLMAFVHLGGAISWHNNHHARPGYFTVKRNWWEFDVHHQLLRLLSFFGLISDIKVLDETPQPAEKKAADFLVQNKWRAAMMIGGRLGQVVLSLTALTFIFQSGLPLWIQIPLATALVLLAGIGLHNLALLGHEGTHFNLSNHRVASSLLGTFFASVIPFHFNTGFGISHAAHHLHTNSEKDPDMHVFGKFNGWWSRLFAARRKATLEYLKLTLSAAFSKNSSLKLPGLTHDELRLLARANLIFSLGFLILEAALLTFLGKAFALAFGLSYLAAYLLSAIRPYLEHAGTDQGKLSRARTFSSGLLDFSFGTINYHLAHHLYPRVPAYSLPAFHQWLISNGKLDESQIVEHHKFGDLLQIIGKHDYGTRNSVATTGIQQAFIMH